MNSQQLFVPQSRRTRPSPSAYFSPARSRAHRFPAPKDKNIYEIAEEREICEDDDGSDTETEDAPTPKQCATAKSAVEWNTLAERLNHVQLQSNRAVMHPVPSGSDAPPAYQAASDLRHDNAHLVLSNLKDVVTWLSCPLRDVERRLANLRRSDVSQLRSLELNAGDFLEISHDTSALYAEMLDHILFGVLRASPPGLEVMKVSAKCAGETYIVDPFRGHKLLNELTELELDGVAMPNIFWFTPKLDLLVLRMIVPGPRFGWRFRESGLPHLTELRLSGCTASVVVPIISAAEHLHTLRISDMLQCDVHIDVMNIVIAAQIRVVHLRFENIPMSFETGPFRFHATRLEFPHLGYLGFERCAGSFVAYLVREATKLTHLKLKNVRFFGGEQICCSDTVEILDYDLEFETYFRQHRSSFSIPPDCLWKRIR